MAQPLTIAVDICRLGGSCFETRVGDDHNIPFLRVDRLRELDIQFLRILWFVGPLNPGQFLDGCLLSDRQPCLSENAYGKGWRSISKRIEFSSVSDWSSGHRLNIVGPDRYCNMGSNHFFNGA